MRPNGPRAADRRPGAPSPTPGTVSSRARNGAVGDTGALSGASVSWRDCWDDWGVLASGRPPGPLGLPGPSSGPSGPSSGPSGPAGWPGPPGPGGSGPGSGSELASRRASSRACSSRPGASKGSRRRRCGRASRAAVRISSSATTSRPCQAARAIAVRAVTRSARMPSTPNAPHTAQIWRSAASGRSTPGRRSRAAATCRASAAVSSPKRVMKPAGSASKASLRRTTSARSAGSWLAVTCTVSPNRSSNCGRSSPSSGFMVPTSRNREGCRTETPSRST